MNKKNDYDKIDKDYFLEYHVPLHIQEVYAISRRLIAIMLNWDIQELTYNCNLYDLLKNYEPVWDKYEFFTILSSLLDIDITTEQMYSLSFFDALEPCEPLVVGQWINNLICTLYNSEIVPNKELRVYWNILDEIQKDVTKKRQFFENFFIVPFFFFILLLIFIAIVKTF
jgi:hypothetical protein